MVIIDKNATNRKISETVAARVILPCGNLF